MFIHVFILGLFLGLVRAQKALRFTNGIFILHNQMVIPICYGIVCTVVAPT